MPLGQARTQGQKWKFRVYIDGVDEGEARFQKCGPLEPEVGTVTYHPGGDMIPIKQPGKVEFPVITMENGLTDSEALYNLFINVVDVAANSGGDDNSFKFTMTIEQLKRNNDVLVTYRVYGCFIKKYNGGDWDGSAQEVTLETIDVEYDYFERV